MATSTSQFSTNVQKTTLQNTSTKVYENLSIPGCLQTLVGKTIIGQGGTIIKSFTHQEPGVDGKRIPIDGLKGVHVNVTGDQGSRYIQLVGFDNDRHRETKFSILKTKVKQHLGALIEEYGQVQGASNITGGERIFTTNVSSGALKSSLGERTVQWDNPTVKSLPQKPPGLGDYEANRSKKSNNRNRGTREGWNVPVHEAVKTHNLGFGFKTFDYDIQEFTVPHPPKTGSYPSFRLEKQLANAKPLRKGRVVRAQYFTTQHTKKEFPQTNLNNPHGIVVGDLIQMDHHKWSKVQDTFLATVVKIDGSNQNTLTVDKNWLAEDLPFYKPNLVTWKTSHCIPYKPDQAEQHAMCEKRKALFLEMESVVNTTKEVKPNNQPKKQTNDHQITIHTMEYDDDQTAWDFYLQALQSLEVGNIGAFEEMVDDRTKHSKDFGVWPTQKPLLHWASQLGHTQAVHYLVNTLGFPLNHVGKWGNTELHRAAFYGHTETANYLLDLGSRDDIINQFGEDPLQSEHSGNHHD